MAKMRLFVRFTHITRHLLDNLSNLFIPVPNTSMNLCDDGKHFRWRAFIFFVLAVDGANLSDVDYITDDAICLLIFYVPLTTYIQINISMN